MISAKLSKVKVPQLLIIVDALNNYQLYLKELIEKVETSDETKMCFSICKELQQQVQKKATKEFPSINNTIKLPFYKLTIIINAFLHYQTQLKNDSYEKAVLTRFTNTLMPQL